MSEEEQRSWLFHRLSAASVFFSKTYCLISWWLLVIPQFQPPELSGFFVLSWGCFVLFYGFPLGLLCIVFFPIVVDGLGKEITAGLESLQSSLLAS